MPSKRPRESDPTTTLEHAHVPKKARTPPTSSSSTIAPNSFISGLVASMVNMLGLGNRASQSRTQMRAKRSLGNTSRGNPKNEPDPSDGVASSSGGILDMIQAIDEKREKVQANGAPSQIAADPTSRPKARSLYPALPDGPETYPFDEGRLKSGRPSPTPPPGGTEVEPIEISDSESSSPSSSSSSSSHRPSSIPTPPLTSTPNATRRPSRPNLRGHVPPKRQYSWMQPAPDSPASTQSRHDMTRKRDLRIRKERGKTQKLKKTASQHQLNRIAMATEGGGDQVQQAGKRVSKMMEMSSSGSRNEKTFAAVAKHLGNTKLAFAELLSRGIPVKTVGSVIEKKPEPEFSPARYQRHAAKAKASAELQRTASMEDIIRKLNKQQLLEDEQIKGRLYPSVPTEMAAARLSQVRAHLANSSFRKVTGTQEVPSKSLQRLRVGQWLNDDVINFYGTMIQQRSEAGIAEATKGTWNVHFMNSFFYTKLSTQGYVKGSLRRWTKKTDIFARDIMIFPINLGQMHWTAAAINFREKRLEYYDSMGDRSSTREVVFQHLMDYLEAEHVDKKSQPFDSTGWVESFAGDTPHQDNGSDCGVFTCQTLDALARGLDLTKPQAKGFEWTSANMPYLRDLMVYEIGQVKLEKRWPQEW